MTFNASELSALATAALNELAVNPPHMTNKALCTALGLDDRPEAYERLRDVLLAQHLVVKGVGAGGTLRRASATDLAAALPQNKKDLCDPRYPDEESLYSPMREVIDNHLTADDRRDLVVTEITAHAKAGSAGTWSHPDVTSVEFRRYRFVPGTHLDVITYEIKPVWSIDVRGVYEAMAHSRAATRSSLLIHVPFADTLTVEADVSAVCEVAHANGVGVITAADPCDGSTWTERVPGRRQAVDPERLDAFIAAHLSPEAQELVAAQAHRLTVPS